MYTQKSLQINTEVHILLFRKLPLLAGRHVTCTMLMQENELSDSLVNVRVEPLIVAPLVGLGQLQEVAQSTAHLMLHKDKDKKKKKIDSSGPGRI